MLHHPSPSIAPSSGTVYMVLDDFGKLGRSYRGADEDKSDEASIIDDLLTGQYNAPVRIIAFNIDEGWCRDASQEIAKAVLKISFLRDRELPADTVKFIEAHLGEIDRKLMASVLT